MSGMDYYDYMRLQNYFLLTLMLACPLSSNAQGTGTPLPTPSSKSSALDSQLLYQLLLGEFSAKSNEPAAAYSLMLDAARKTGDAALYRRAVQIALQARSGDSSLSAAKAWAEAIPLSKEANRYVLQILLSLNRVQEALEPLKRDLFLTPASERRDFIWAIPGLFERVSDKSLATQIVQKALGSVLQDPELGASAWAVVGRMWLIADDGPAALAAAVKGQAVNFRSEHPALLALALMGAQQPSAEGLVKKHLSEKTRPEFRMAYVKALLSSKRDADAIAELKTLSKHNPDYPESWLLQGALSLQNAQLELAERHFQHYLDLIHSRSPVSDAADMNKGASQAYMSLAEIAVQRKDFAQADTWLLRVVNPDDSLSAQIRRATLIAQQGKLDEALSLVHGLPERTSTDDRAKRAAEVQLLRNHKQYARARQRLESEIARFPHDTDLIYDLAMVAENMGDLIEMERLLRQVMAAKPDNPQAYNALGYSLADHHVRLPEAKELIAKALSLAPSDPYIMDSLAWVEFRIGNKAEALKLLQKAYTQKPDAEIAAHLGEVLWSLDQVDQARQIWQEGLKLNPDNETMAETLKRLRVSL